MENYHGSVSLGHFRFKIYSKFEGKVTMSNIRVFDLYNEDIVIFFGRDYCHSYYKGNREQIQEDIEAYLAGSNPKLWDGNEIEHFSLEDMENDDTVEKIGFAEFIYPNLQFLTDDEKEKLINGAKTYADTELALYQAEAG